MKKMISLALALALGLSLAGCGNSAIPTASPQSEFSAKETEGETMTETEKNIGVVAPPVFTKQPEAAHYVIEGSDYAAPVFTAAATLPEGSGAAGIGLLWTINGEPVGEGEYIEGHEAVSTFTATQLQGKPVGVYRVACSALCKINGETFRTDSYAVNFIVCRGILKNSVLTFSDVHQDWNNVGTAILDTMLAHEGLIPALVISTGDWANPYLTGNVEENCDRCANEVIGRISLQLGGIDTVWISGNHDNGYAAEYTNWNSGIDLGLNLGDYASEKAGISGTGILFDSRSEGYQKNAESSLNASGLIVIGINFEDALAVRSGEANGRYDKAMCDYGDGTEAGDSVYKHLQTALDSVAADYHGEVVIISTHSGVHVLGVDPASNSQSAFKDPDYCITGSAAVVQLVNSYVERVGMNVVWLFGHDHSKGEEEFVKLPGDTIISTVDFNEQTSEEIPLLFTYGHAGYITDNLKMTGHSRYSFLVWDESGVERKMKVTNKEQDSLSDKLDFSVSFPTENGAAAKP